MNKNGLILTIILIAITYSGKGQQFDNWYFGRRAAISFIPGTPSQQVPLSLSNSEMVADEGTISVSDDAGNLLFYSNGVTIFNKQHDTMLNGTNIMGNISSCQTGAVPHPGNDSIYYLFTTDAIENDFANGYRYALINIKGDNGRGEVILKNQLLWPSCTERLAIIRHANGIDAWLITNDYASNIFRAWLITCNGIQPNPVTSTVGEIIDGYRDIHAGIIKVSPNGKMLVQTHFPLFDEIIRPPNFCQLFDFNNNSGVISNPKKIFFSAGQYTHCEFSPDSKLLYLSRPFEKIIDQIEVTLASTAAIINSRISIPTSSSYYDIQLAPDRKIYCSSPSAPLAVIQMPDRKGLSCAFQEDYVSLTPGSAFIGLPSHINDITETDNPDNGFIYSITDSCTRTIQFNAYSNLTAPVIWNWDFGNGQTSSLQNPVISFSNSSNTYRVRLRIKSASSCGVITRSRYIQPAGAIGGKAAFEYVVRCDSNYVRFINNSSNVADPQSSFQWFFGDGNTSADINPIHTYSSPGIYTVKLKINTGLSCLNDSATLQVEVKDFTVKTIPDQVITVGQQVLLSTERPATYFRWSPAFWLNDTTIRNPVATPLQDITYKVYAANADGCKGEDSVFIRVIQYNDIYIPNAFTPNGDGKNDNLMPYFPGDITLKNFSIYNRWGQRVFATSQRGIGWDGKVNNQLQQSGTFIWTIQLNNSKGELIEKKGSITLIR